MAATCTVSQETDPSKLKKGTITKLSFAWTAHTDGTVSAVGGAKAISGKLISARFIPGTTLPDSGYDATLVDKYGYDWLGGFGANIPNSAANALTNVILANSLAPILATSLMPAFTNCGSSGQGTLEILYEVI